MDNPAVREIKKRGGMPLCKICDERHLERNGINIIVYGITRLICARCLVKIQRANSSKKQQLGRLK